MRLGKRFSKRSLFVLAIPLLLGITVAAGYLGFQSSAAQATGTAEAPPTVGVEVCDVEKSVTAPGSLVNTQRATLNMPFNGTLAQVAVQPGDHVKAGQVLGRLENKNTPQEIAADISDAELAVIKAQQELDALVANAGISRTSALNDIATYSRAVRDAQYTLENYNLPAFLQGLETIAAVDKMKAQLDEALAAFDPYKYYPASDDTRYGLLVKLNEAQSNYDAAVKRLNYEYALQVAEANLAKARQEYDKYKDGPAADALALARATLENAQARLDLAKGAQAVVDLVAPIDGVILEVKAQLGESLTEGSPLLTMNNPQALEVLAKVIEEDLPLVQIGQAAKLYFDAAPDAEVTGRVERIVPQRTTDDRPLYQVYLSLEQPPLELVEGMTADTVIILERAEQVLCLPRALVRAGAGQSATVQVWTGDHTEQRTIQVGLRGDTNVAILSGLQAGDQVVAR